MVDCGSWLLTTSDWRGITDCRATRHPTLFLKLVFPFAFIDIYKLSSNYVIYQIIKDNFFVLIGNFIDIGFEINWVSRFTTMSTHITELTEQEFRKQALLSKDNSSAMFDNNSYKQGLTFSIPMKHKALKYCQKLVENNLSSVLVQGTYCFTVWVKKEDNDASIEQSSIQQTPMAFAPQNVTQEVPRKKITRVYRGQTYEVEIPDYSAIQQSPLNKPKARRKYRGQYID